jgi:hypothetical protein
MSANTIYISALKNARGKMAVAKFFLDSALGRLELLYAKKRKFRSNLFSLNFLHTCDAGLSYGTMPGQSFYPLERLNFVLDCLWRARRESVALDFILW